MGNQNCVFADPKSIASYILTHMQNEQYDGRMSSFYSRYLVEALVQASVEAKRGANRTRTNANSSLAMTLDQFKELAAAQERRVHSLTGQQTYGRLERPV
ncbi:MAG: hypothetical protein P4L33_15045 [Capsulimonadaceae bacterium]|nr:hypothetical protein [Capsulimonadaceae bacterium]